MTWMCAMHPGKTLAAMLLLAPALLRAAPADDFRPSGPVTLTADRGEWTQGGQMRYEGNVALASDTLTIRGQTMQVTQLAGGQFTALISGDPAQLDHAAQPGAQGVAAQSVSARAQQIEYDSRNGVVELKQQAQLTRGGDEVSGNAISYAVAERRVRASGGDGGQVRIVIQPPAPKAKDAP